MTERTVGTAPAGVKKRVIPYRVCTRRNAWCQRCPVAVNIGALHSARISKVGDRNSRSSACPGQCPKVDFCRQRAVEMTGRRDTLRSQRDGTGMTFRTAERPSILDGTAGGDVAEMRSRRGIHRIDITIQSIPRGRTVTMAFSTLGVGRSDAPGGGNQ